MGRHDHGEWLSGREGRGGAGSEGECGPGKLQDAPRAMVLKTDSIPGTPDRAAEHLVAVVFGRPTFIEVAFARFKLVDGAGCSIIYSHRIYGEKIGDAMSAWLSSNGPEIEKALMAWTSAPSPKSLSREQRQTRT